MDTNDVKPEGKKKSKLMLIIIAAVVLGGGGFGAFKFLGGSDTSAAASGAVDAHGKPIANSEPVTGESQDGSKPVAPGDKRKRMVVVREPAVVNLRQSNGTRYLKVRMGFEFSDDAVADEMREMDTQISDYINERLSVCDIAQMDNIAGRNKMKRELLTGINELLKKGAVERIYFTEFVIQ